MRLKNLLDIKEKYQRESINIFLRCDLNITDNDSSRIEESSIISKEALLARISLWDGIENQIKQRKKKL